MGGKEIYAVNAVRNYQKELDKITEAIKERTAGGLIQPPTLFLHSCCAPCSSYVLEYLRLFFRITVFYYNPNISMEAEYRKRVAEQKRLIAEYNAKIRKRENSYAQGERPEAANCGEEKSQMPCIATLGYPIEIIEGDYEPERFYEMAKGLEQCPEGGVRCFACYELRLRETVERALAGGYDYFTTTLTISPLKNAAKLNEIGEQLAQRYGVKWLPSDFKKRGGYQRSIELSKEYGLYRQDYCGCVYSRRKTDASVENETQQKDNVCSCEK